MGFFLFSIFYFLFSILIFVYFFKYETIVSRNGLSLGYSERDTSNVGMDMKEKLKSMALLSYGEKLQKK